MYIYISFYFKNNIIISNHLKIIYKGQQQKNLTQERK